MVPSAGARIAPPLLPAALDGIPFERRSGSAVYELGRLVGCGCPAFFGTYRELPSCLCGVVIWVPGTVLIPRWRLRVGGVAFV